MKKFFTFFAAALMSVSMFGATVTEDIPLNAETWTWNPNCQLTFNDGVMRCITIGEYGGTAAGWDPARDLSEWDKLVVVVESMSGCDGEYNKMQVYLRDLAHKDDYTHQLETTLGLDAADNEQHYMEIDLNQEREDVDLTAAGVIGIQSQPGGADFRISRVYLEKEEEEPQVQTDETVIYVAFPSANKPENIEVAGTFEAGAWGMRVFNGDWYTCNEDLFTSEEDTLKFRDADNHDMILCQRIPANGEGEDKWVQLLLYCKDFAVVSWKGEMYRVIEEQNFFDATNYAWKEGMPEPEEPTEGVVNTAANVKAVKVIRNGQVLILKNGKTFNALGAEVK